jgi:energy-coupling factor transporter ATP-binding protein EcfA2
MSKQEPLKIVSFKAENIMKLSAVSIVPKDNMIEITGKNGAGKSSILDSIVMALTGGKSIPEKPIKSGKDKGKIVLDLGMYQITRSFTPDNSYLKIETVDGSTIKSPQKFLDELVGSISFDPLDFINRDQKEQRRVLLELIGVNVDDLDNKKKLIYDERTAIGRDLKSAEASLKGLVYDSNIKQTTEVSISDLTTKLQETMQFNSQWDADAQKNEVIKSQAMRNRASIKEMEETIQKIKDENVLLKDKYDTTLERLNANPKIDIDELQLQISGIDEKNKTIRNNQSYLVAKQSKDDCQSLYDSKTEELSNIETQRNELLSSATMPVEGLSFNESELLYNNIPLSQASDGEKLMIGLGISMALNPTLRVLRIKDGSLLDSDNRQIIKDKIKDKGFQLWMESVSSDKSVGIFIEDGGIVAIDGEPQVKEVVKHHAAKTKEVAKSETKPTPETPDDW